MFRPKKILVPTDFSKNADYALRQAIEMAEQFGAKMNIIHVDEKNTEKMPFFFLDDAKLTEIHNSIEGFINDEFKKIDDQYFKGKDIEHEFITKHGHSHSVIIEHAKENKCDLIVMPSKGQSAIEGFFFGSTTEKVARKAPCSVFIVREKE